MEVAGKIIKVGETKSYGDKGFKKRELVVNEALEINGKQYDNPLTIEFTQDKTQLLDKFKVGQSVSVAINLRGREYTKDGETRYFNSIQGWKVEEANQAELTPEVEGNEDLPF